MAGLNNLGEGNFPKKQRPVPNEGTQIGRCYSIIDLGTHMKAFPGQEAVPTHLVQFAWEFPLLPQQVFNAEVGPQPLAVFNEYTASLGDKANLAKHLKSWTGLGVIPPSFDLKMCLGQVCQIQIIHQRAKVAQLEPKDSIYGDGKVVYAKVQNIMQLMKDPVTKQYLIQVPPIINKPLFLDLGDRFNWADFHACPKWIQDKIKTCLEWSGILQKHGPEPVNPNAQATQQFAPQQQVQQPAQNIQAQNDQVFGSPVDNGGDSPF
jgi:hypothetical protein